MGALFSSFVQVAWQTLIQKENTEYQCQQMLSPNVTVAGVCAENQTQDISFNPTPFRSLLIGINYAEEPNSALKGCANDIMDVWKHLHETEGRHETVMLCDAAPDGGWPTGLPSIQKPTRASILRELELIAAWTHSVAGARCWIHYSGHGSQCKDEDGDESDQLDECLVPCDYTTAGIISDDELLRVFGNNALASDSSVVFVVDACHSGSMLDLPYINDGTIDNIARIHTHTNTRNCGPLIISISGCRDDQTSADAKFGQRWQGALTKTLLFELRTGERRAVVLAQKLRKKLRDSSFLQRPQLASSEVLCKQSTLFRPLRMQFLKE